MKSKKKPKKKVSALDKYVIFSLSSLIIFTIVAIVVQVLMEQELSSTLITCFFSCFGGELLMLAMIKRLKLKKGEIGDDGIFGKQLGDDTDNSVGNSRAD
ncbi:hypothetical protein [Butyrivibrio sp. INlla21]|uniref:hypothetical protein n=1 Tax=Butyrivibrio sp. INlla21 TaxID=1520811 RepID=UPI001160387C|nr:hypothetical protein [Butyrivibrio sp. INlla21]